MKQKLALVGALLGAFIIYMLLGPLASYALDGNSSKAWLIFGLLIVVLIISLGFALMRIVYRSKDTAADRDLDKMRIELSTLSQFAKDEQATRTKYDEQTRGTDKTPKS